MDSADSDGCEIAGCSQSMVLSDVFVTELAIGSPTLFDRAAFDYAAIDWDRSDLASLGARETFRWNVRANSPQ